jgi:hypothetical protein
VITARDRKIIFILVPLVLMLGYWFMVLSPKRAESQKVTTELTQAQSARDTAEQQVAQLGAAKASFASDYATIIRLGKAVPSSVDMASLLVQLDRAARGTGVKIDDFKPGIAKASTSDGPPASGSTGGTPPGGGANPAAPGAPKADSFPGKQAQQAGNGVTQANGQNQANADKAGGAAAAPSSAPTAPGLQSVSLTFTLEATFFDMADFMHRLKRFVRVVNDQIVVRGRLLSIDSFDFSRTGPATDLLRANVEATIWLSPPDQGVSAGATASGPAAAAGASAPSTAPSPPSTPTAAATP